MPSNKNYVSKPTNFSNMTMSARVYHPATNLLPPSPPVSPTGMAPTFGANTKTGTFASISRQNSGKYS